MVPLYRGGGVGLLFLCLCVAASASLLRTNTDTLSPPDSTADNSRQDFLTSIKKELAEQLGKENDFVGDTKGRFDKAIAFQTEIEEKLQELLNKAELCKETAIPAIFAVESKLPPFLEAADRSGDIDPMKKFVARAHSFTTSNYAYPTSKTDGNRAKVASLKAKTLAGKIDPARGLTVREESAWLQQSATWGSLMSKSLEKEAGVAANASAIIHQSFFNTQYHVWHVLPDFIPAMKARGKYLPSYAPLHKALLVLAEHCRKEALSLNQTIGLVRMRQNRLKARARAFMDMYSHGGGLPNGTAVDVLRASKTSTEDLLVTAQTLFGDNPKVGQTARARAENLLRYWLSQLAIRDPRSVKDNANFTSVKRGSHPVSEQVEAGVGGAAAADLASFGNASSPEQILREKLQTDAAAQNRARKWVSYWKRAVLEQEALEEQERLELQKQVMAQEAALKQAASGGGQVNTSVAAPSTATAAAAAPVASPAATKVMPVVVRSRYLQFLNDWEARLGAAPEGSRAHQIALDWVSFWQEKLGVTAQKKK